MKHRTLIGLIAMGLCGALAAPRQAAAQTPRSYFVVNLGNPLGGPVSLGSSVNDEGWAAGGATTADSTEHAVLWLGTALHLGSLGGPNSNIAWPNPSTRGALVGIAELAAMDPNREGWSCAGFFPTTTYHVCRGFLWRDDKMTALPTLGGTNGYGASLNNRGQAVGWAETTVHDSTCTPPQILQFEAVIWGPNKDQIVQLPPFPGDPDSAATGINDAGQVIGISGICGTAIGEFSAHHALLWENGQPIDLGNFGGVAWNTPTAINNRGQVAGFADLPGDEAGGLNPIGFLWTKQLGLVKLLPYPGDVNSLAWGINEQGTVVGQSIDSTGNSRAVIWQYGVMTSAQGVLPVDLNSLIPADSSLYVVEVNDINDRGEISGQACVVSDGVCGSEIPAVLLVPECAGADGTALALAGGAPRPLLSDEVRRQAFQRLGHDLSDHR
jgi:probable HAF family extracellular repeat protein